MSGKKIFTITKEDDGIRLDRWVKRHRPDIPHGMLQKLLRKGAIKLDGKKAETSTRLVKGQQLTLPQVEKKDDRPATTPKESSPEDAEQYLIRNILYEDSNLFIFNKPAGLATQGGTGVKRSVDSMLMHLKGAERDKPRLVHRIDKDTSGILVVARTLKAANELGALFKTRAVDKTYWAIVVGTPNPRMGKINLPIADKQFDGDVEKSAVVEKGGKPATTLYQVIDNASKSAAWVALKPITGRMHQLRVHLLAIGHPILGDGKYGGRKAFMNGFPNQMHLHAREISFTAFGKKIHVKAPLPAHMQGTFDTLGFEEGQGNNIAI